MSAEPDSRTDLEGESAEPESCSAEGRLAAAKSVLERVLGRCGEEYWSAADYGEAQSRETIILEDWATKDGCWLESPEWGVWELSLGMGEHHVRQEQDRVFKATKKMRFGVYPSCSGRATGDPVDQLKLGQGTPHQYLMRLDLLNRWSSTLEGMNGRQMNRLEGCMILDDQFSIITSQPWFPHDEVQTTVDDIAAWMAKHGFKMITAGIWHNARLNLALFDVKPSNMIRSGGHIIPIDVIPIEPFGRMKQILEAICA